MASSDDDEVSRISGVYYLADMIGYFEHNRHLLEKSIAKGNPEAALAYLTLLDG